VIQFTATYRSLKQRWSDDKAVQHRLDLGDKIQHCRLFLGSRSQLLRTLHQSLNNVKTFITSIYVKEATIETARSVALELIHFTVLLNQ